MKHDHDFSALRNILALKKLETPLETEVDRFLIEFHRRQRAQLLVPESSFARAISWLRERAEGFRLVPSLSCGAAFAALLVVALVGFSPQTQVASSNGSYQLSLRMPNSDSAFALIPAAFSKASLGAAPKTDSLSFTPASRPSATRFILANPRMAYDATAAF
jgi:hypothetical protein